MDPQNFFQTNPANAASTPVSAEPQREEAPAQVTPDTAVAPDQSQAGQPQEEQVDYKALVEQERQRAETSEAERQRLSGTLNQVQQWAQNYEQTQRQQTQRQQAAQRRREIMDQAGRMSVSDANDFLDKQLAGIESEYEQRMQHQAQQLQQQMLQERMRLGTPLYVKDLVSRNGLPPEAEAELMSYGDPNMAAQQVPHVKRRYEEKKMFQDQINQLSRSRQADQLQSSGVGMVGGTSISSDNYDIPDGLSPEDKALHIYKQMHSLN